MSPDADEAVGRRSRVAGTIRIAAYFLLLLALILAGHLTPFREHMADVDAWRARLDASGPWAPVLFVTGTAVLVAMGVPRIIFCFIAGVLFGFTEGLVLSQIGPLIGAYGLFLMTRWGGREWVEARVAAHPRLLEFMNEPPSFWTVFLIRQIPAPGLVTNVFLGLTPAKHRTFLAGTVLGYLPEGIVATLAGSGLISRSLSQALPQFIAAIGVFVLVAWVLRRIQSRLTIREPAC